MVCIVAVALFGLPGVARAAQSIGSDLGGNALGSSCSVADGCVVVQDKIGSSFVEAGAAGVITQWTTRTATGLMALRTYRHRSSEQFVDGEIHATAFDQADSQTGDGGMQSFLARIPVVAGDYISLVVGDGASFGFRQSPPSGTRAFRFGDFANDVDMASGEATELYLRVGIEADTDGDGFGDETQDPCVGCGGSALQPPAGPAPAGPAPAGPAPDPYASIRGSGPRISLAGSARASRTGVVPVVLKNPYAFALKGRLTLMDGKRKAGAKGSSLPANATKPAKVKLTRKAFRRLKRKRRLGLTALARGKAAVGKGRTTRKKLRVSAPRPKRRKRRRPSGGDRPVDGTYVGKTVQGRSITIKRINNGRQIRVFATTALTSLCLRNGSPSDPEIVSILPPVPFAVDAAGNFSLDAPNESEDYDPNYRIKGKFTTDRVTGFFAWRRLKTTGFNNQSCVTKELTFEATRQG